MRMTSKLTGGPIRFETEVRGHNIVVDVPQEMGGTDTGPMPPELLVSALGTCVGIYAVGFCQKHDISTDGLIIHTDWEKGGEPTRITSMTVTIELPAGVPAKKHTAFMRTVEACLIHNTLCLMPQIDIKVVEPVEA